ncbi:calcium-binding protein [Archangium violaceum]|uniref:thrombospondin type 3 repeat-containing protein n=1 Tax=Archangium violaceum TaxID=83451 RepID=UPI00194F0819|nr:thrombospondin type 3 repeat-containing protein [Archangium violaceum]QRN95489.1 calcium-binding protein [Archangium violaceum]
MSALPRIAWLLVPVLLLSCSDAGLYALDGRGPSGKDRADFTGNVCVPLAGGEAFPVKVLFAVQGGAGLPEDMKGSVSEALGTLASRFSVPYIKFSLVAFHTVATGLLGRFDDATALQASVPRYATYQESGPTSMRSALKLAKSILSGDMQTSCPGDVARTRYLVVLVVTSEDLSCESPVFNAGIDSRCSNLPDSSACSQCELAAVTGELKALVQQFGAGEVTVQPVYVRNTAEAHTAAQVAAIANAGGTEAVTTDFVSLPTALGGLDYASLQSNLKMKRFLAFNRNVVVRAGQFLPDSDGDGVADSDELARGLDPTIPDSDQDGVMDGIELRMGLDPTPGHVDPIPGCNAALDEDGDRLNTCEERVLGTDPCVGDTDGDGLPDLVEALANTNPLLAEDLLDSDRDGIPNITEVEAHGDPLSADIAFQTERGYGYSLAEAEPTADGRACYAVRAENVTLVPTLERPNPIFPGRRIPSGTNDIYLYMQVGRDNDPRGSGIGALYIRSLRYSEEEGRTPSGTLTFTPDDFILGT